MCFIILFIALMEELFGIFDCIHYYFVSYSKTCLKQSLKDFNDK